MSLFSHFPRVLFTTENRCCTLAIKPLQCLRHLGVAIGSLALLSIYCYSSSLAQSASDEPGQIDLEEIRREIKAARQKSSPKELPADEAPAAKAQIRGIGDSLIDELEATTTSDEEMVPIEPPSRERPSSATAVARPAKTEPAATPPYEREYRDSLQGAELEIAFRKLQKLQRDTNAKLLQTQGEKQSAQDSLRALQQEVTRLRKEIAESKRRLVLAETEVERLAQAARGAAPRQTVATPVATAATSQPVREVVQATTATSSYSPRQETDVVVATVIAEKVYLRSGPGKDHSPLMTVSKGTRLTVETKKGEWLRVVGPTGGRAWVSTEVVEF